MLTTCNLAPFFFRFGVLIAATILSHGQRCERQLIADSVSLYKRKLETVKLQIGELHAGLRSELEKEAGLRSELQEERWRSTDLERRVAELSRLLGDSDDKILELQVGPTLCSFACMPTLLDLRGTEPVCAGQARVV